MVFAFNPNGDGWVILGPNNSYNLRCPRDLSGHIVDAAERGVGIDFVAISLDGSWFLNTGTQIRYKSNAVRHCMEQHPAMPLTQLEWVVFMPDPDAYFASFRLWNGRQYPRWRGVPESLDAQLRTGTVSSKGVASLSVGKDGCWVMILNDGTIFGCAITSSSLKGKLQSKSRGPSRIKSVKLDLSAEDRWFIEYQDGSVAYDLPTEWHAKVESILCNPPSSLYRPPPPQPTVEVSSTTVESPQRTTASVELRHPESPRQTSPRSLSPPATQVQTLPPLPIRMSPEGNLRPLPLLPPPYSESSPTSTVVELWCDVTTQRSTT